MRRAIERFFGLRRLVFRDFVLLFVALLLLSLLITFAVMKIVESTGKYNIRYYEPRDFQREEMFKKEAEKK